MTIGKFIEENENVILYLNQNVNFMINLKRGQVFHSHKGYVNLNDIIGKRYGSKVKSNTGSEFYIVKPLIKDYIMKSHRKTQIIYPKDIAVIIHYSGISSGSRVIEAGTGSGALTMALAYYVKPNGRVYSYENREEHLNLAKKNLEKAGLLDYVELKLKDVNEGFDERDVDAVILDLPSPWKIVDKAYDALADWGVLISYSPTIEQVIKTVETLEKYNFVGIECLENMQRRWKIKTNETRPETLMIGHTGYILCARKTLGDNLEVK
ncbi:MAG: tRNA (adenine-N1)-methyltransferase [Candidatus Methanomethylicia archaeon]|nr:tRNA (adenine-N1)-methyltransferase [Candidatus Methanomethylicia archaeon]MCX8168839.1 tRNA (adenine-N1)-methyltransferase [Candidatus Methanomethylicia archaeon]MDW7988571.1 tRNA (adenine-N1)-methyltransferase [Nitrososphaerota archaeon]